LAAQPASKVGCDLAVGRVWDVGVELHREPGGGVPEASLDDPWVLAVLDQEAGGDVSDARGR
jgi:hypothetical protein